jgi:shikimate dehydrogenase
VRLVYSLYDLAGAAEGAEALPLLIAAAKRLGFAGLNVTHPFKQRVIPLLDGLSDDAARIGAVNTVSFRDGRSMGFNTDYLGFAETLRRRLSGARFGNVVQLGAGGAGSATARALLDHGVGALHIHDVDHHRAQSLADSLRSDFGISRVTVPSDLSRALASADGLVNATPVGMVGHVGSPVSRELVRPPMWVVDIVYFPLETELLRQAAQAGCRTVNGVPMVVFQAAAAFDIFTGMRADRERMLARATKQWSN